MVEVAIYLPRVVRFPQSIGFFDVIRFFKSLCFLGSRFFPRDLVGQQPLFGCFMQPTHSLLSMHSLWQSHFLHFTHLIVKFP